MTTQATAVAGRLRHIRDRNNASTKRRSAERVARKIYTEATIIYIVSASSFVAAFPDASLLVASPASATAARGQIKTELLTHVRTLPPERKHHPNALSDSRYYDIIQSICLKTATSD